MKQKIKNICLLLLALGAGFALNGQVRIGGNTPAVAGALLDLNSAKKGALVLANVELTAMNRIPTDNPAVFPGIQAGVNDTQNTDFTGATVYNTNKNLLPYGEGVYVWKGDEWKCLCEYWYSAPLSCDYYTDGFITAMYTFQQQELSVYASSADDDDKHCTYQWYKKENTGDWEMLIDSVRQALHINSWAYNQNMDSVVYKCVIYNGDYTSTKEASFPAIIFIHLGDKAQLDAIAAANSGLIPVTLKTPTGTIQIAHANLGAEYGAYNAASGTPADKLNDAGDLGDLYQWGRQANGYEKIVWGKNPTNHEIRFDAGSSEKKIYDSAITYDANGQINAPAEYVQKFINNRTDWTTDNNPALWNEKTKTVNDPCPSGWRVPSRDEWAQIYQGTIADGTAADATQNTWQWRSHRDFVVSGTYVVTYGVGSDKDVSKQVIFPKSAKRKADTGNLDNSTAAGSGATVGYYWSSSAALHTSSNEGDKVKAAVLGLTTTRIQTSVYSYRGMGFPVRCIKQ
ncbi:MAG: fibrobacter succinogenes major paralogous domain-containing protein [Dysgonamonadaceae bacterium]|nr:fibrobacter succinogenes major paralogous domain-containing protein [Dysgonamonadaceae bacterium]